jgi:hypothetical protein
VEILVQRASGSRVKTIVALIVGSTLGISLQSVPSIRNIITSRISTSSWECILAGANVAASSNVEVLASGTGVGGVLSICTGEVSSAQVVGGDFEVTIGEAGTSRILTSRWELALALSDDLVEVLAGLAAQ